MTSPDSSLSAIRTKVRRLTASPAEEQLSTADIDEYINTFYTQDFPYAIKIGQLKTNIEFFTEPNKDRYVLDGTLSSSLDFYDPSLPAVGATKVFSALDINSIQGIRDPIYIEGYQGSLSKSRQEFYNEWPKLPTEQRFAIGNVSTITDITTADPGVVTAVAHGLTTNDKVTITGVVGMTEVNDITFTITVLTVDTFSITATTQAYTSGGIATKIGPFTFTISATPFLKNSVTIGGPSSATQSEQVEDDGAGSLIDVKTQLNVGSINYLTGAMSITFTNLITAGQEIVVFVSAYSASRPVTMLFFNNELVMRPVPDEVYRIEFEAFLTPVQFILTSDNPVLKQWYQYIALGAAEKVLQDRGDFEGLELVDRYKNQQEALVLERQAVFQIGQRNATEFSSNQRGDLYGNRY